MLYSWQREVNALDITFADPGIDYMLQSILAFQQDDENDFWSEPLYHFYPQLDARRARQLPLEQRKDYIASVMRHVYDEAQPVICQKVTSYSDHWSKCRPQIEEALSEAFDLDCAASFQNLRCNISLNPIEPRFLLERRFDLFYLNSERGAIGEAIHEIIHIVWFHVWNRIFQDSFEEYERPSLKWILSEMVVEPIMRDPRLSSINPYFRLEDGGCVYPYFYDMVIDHAPILETLYELYRAVPIADFMRRSYACCQAHEQEIRAHIHAAEHAER